MAVSGVRRRSSSTPPPLPTVDSGQQVRILGSPDRGSGMCVVNKAKTSSNPVSPGAVTDDVFGPESGAQKLDAKG